MKYLKQKIFFGSIITINMMFMISYCIKNNHKFYKYSNLDPNSHLWMTIQNSIKSE